MACRRESDQLPTACECHPTLVKRPTACMNEILNSFLETARHADRSFRSFPSSRASQTRRFEPSLDKQYRLPRYPNPRSSLRSVVSPGDQDTKDPKELIGECQGTQGEQRGTRKSRVLPFHRALLPPLFRVKRAYRLLLTRCMHGPRKLIYS